MYVGNIINIAIIEDDPIDYRVIEGLLRRIKGLEYDVAWAKSFEEANSLLGQHKFDIALIDYSIGPHSGIDVLRTNGGRESMTPMVMLTGAGSLEVDIEAMDAGAYDFLDKAEMSSAQLERAIRYAIEARRMETDIKMAREKADVASKAKSNFLSHLSHDLKTPLNAIVGFAEMILSGFCKTEDIEDYISQIYASGRHLTEMIDDLLTLTYFDLQKAKCLPRGQNIDEVLAEVIHLTSFSAQEKDISVTALQASKGGRVFADSKALIRVLVNAITVAIKHSERKRKIRLSSVVLDHETSLLVWWDGSRIPSEVVAEVMNDDPYSSDAYTTGSNGIVLSLTIAHKYMLMHGGSMTIDDQPEGGMCISLVFPHGPAGQDSGDDEPGALIMN